MSAQAKKSSKEKDKLSRQVKEKTEKNTEISSCNPEDIIFALDIGTRTVVGIVGVKENDKFKVISAEVLEHKSRAMLDGQIHDIVQVAEITGEIKNKLEKKTGYKLTKVAIAAAGRVLKTCEVRVDRDIDSALEIDKELISSLEIEGIQLAQLRLDNSISREEKTQFYCVGYSVINYYLNGFAISQLSGHRGSRIGADILATFLPHIVVDSLYTVMDKVGLEVTSLTLEPIAAINVTIPKELRLLNIALVDIGAGTSDIAITRDGSVVAYAMAPIAGDEITEQIAQNYLVDFNSAEKIKLAVTSNDEDISFTDILSKKQTVKVQDVVRVIKPAVEILAATISQKIQEYNHKTPNAVFLIGGGSQIPGLTDFISENLGLPKDRVVVRGREVVQNIKFSSRKLLGPEAITPFGIAVTAMLQKGQDFLHVTVNDRKVRLFNSKRLTVADALILIGYNPEDLIGKTGKSLTFTVNSEKKAVRGGFGSPAEILVNDKPSNLETVLMVGDKITVKPAENGTDASARLYEVIKGINTGSVLFNGERTEIGTRITLDGITVKSDVPISEGDNIEIEEILTIADIARKKELDINNFDIYVNGLSADKEYTLNNADIVSLEKKSALETLNNSNEPVNMDEKKVLEIESLPAAIMGKSLNAGEIELIVNGNKIALAGNKSNYIFVDIFNFINFDLSNPQGTIVLKLNGRQAAFTDPIREGDNVEIYWDNTKDI
ncbi:MAG: cell division FtsA domain-containing protein [Bacillota bacterium]|nr:cell division FtsA domain-containing protein [Bacillota bacterium]